MKKHLSLSDRAFDVTNIILVSIITVIIVYPLIYVLSASISDPVAVNTGQMWLWPTGITFEGFRRVLENSDIWLGYRNTIIYTALGTLLHLIILLPAGYALSRKELMGKKYILWFMLITMFFNGGLIPTYLVIEYLGMIDTIWVMIVPGVVGAWSVLVVRSFFEQTVPDSLVESAKMDGASTITVFLKLVLPLSKPIIAVMALFHAVGLWNQYFNALIYLTDSSMHPLQLILRNILIINQSAGVEGSRASMSMDGTAGSIAEQLQNASLIQYAVMIVSTLPLLLVYPFIQKYFVKGVLIGSVKE